MSILSSGSVESDWSDEELEELEKMFGSIQHKSSMAETTTGISIYQNVENVQNLSPQPKDERLNKLRKITFCNQLWNCLDYNHPHTNTSNAYNQLKKVFLTFFSTNRPRWSRDE